MLTNVFRVLWRRKELWIAVIAVSLLLFPLSWMARRNIARTRPLELAAPDTSAVSLMQISPDGKRLAQVLLASSKPTVRFRNAQTGEVENTSGDTSAATFSSSYQKAHVTSYARQANPLAWIAFSPDNMKLHAVDSAGAAFQWDAATGILDKKTPSFLPMGLGRVIAVSPDGATLITLKGTIQNPPSVWNRATGRKQCDLQVRLWSWQGLFFAPDGRTIASAEKDQTVKLWDARTGRLLRTLPKHRGAVASLAFSSDGKTLGSASHSFGRPSRCELRLWTMANGREKRGAIRAPDWIEHLAFTNDGRLAGTAFNSVYLWDSTTGRLLKTMRGNWHVSFDRTGTSMACSAGDAFGMNKNAYIWNISDAH